MATRQGRCTNFGNCSAADKKQIFPVPDGADFVCSECGRQLTDIGRPPGKGSPLAVILGILLLLLVAAGLLVFHLMAPTSPKVPGVSPAKGSSPTMGSAATILRLSGSNTIGSDLAPALAQAFLKQQGATDTTIIPGANDEEKLIQGTLPGESAPSKIEVRAHGSATAFTDLADGSCDVGMASRKIRPDEIGKLSSLGDMTSPASEYVLGLDGIAVIVNQANPVTSLTKEQLAQIFSGQVTDWPAVGGRNGSIKLYARDDKSGTFDSFKSIVLGSGQLASSAKRFEDSGTLSDAVANDPNGIGFIGLPYVKNAKAIAVAERGALPMLPNRFTVATEDYPLSRRLYLYTPENPQNKYTRKFVQFAISKAGQDIVAENAFVAQTVVGQLETVSSAAPAEYKRLTNGAERLSLDFRFRTGRSDLDNKALVDLDRVIGFVSDLHYSGNGVLLFGFADSTGNAAMNQKLSLDRARTVEQQFQQRGLHPGTVRGYGADLPVASNDSEDGREKNRRVEIWIRK